MFDEQKVAFDTLHVIDNFSSLANNMAFAEITKGDERHDCKIDEFATSPKHRGNYCHVIKRV